MTAGLGKVTSVGADYKKHYREFSQNVAYAARAWHHHVHLNNRAAEDASILKALNEASRFWLDLRYSAVQTTIIFLGKIFDTDSRVFNVYKTVRAADENQEYFSKEKLRERKVRDAGEFEGLDEYINNASALEKSDLKTISAEVKKAKAIWEHLKPLRDVEHVHPCLTFRFNPSNAAKAKIYMFRKPPCLHQGIYAGAAQAAERFDLRQT